MNSGPTSERIYDALKSWILSGSMRPGDRLDPSVIAERMNCSVTPVRDALNILTGENLVETHTGVGFNVPHVIESDLRDLYEWSGQILLLAIRHSRPVQRQAHTEERAAPLDDVAMLFDAIAAESRNVEHCRANRSTTERLSIARLAEATILSDRDEELRLIDDAFVGAHSADLKRYLAAYFRRRVRAAADITRAIYRGS